MTSKDSLPSRIITWLTVTTQLVAPLRPTWAHSDATVVSLAGATAEQHSDLNPSRILESLVPSYPPTITNVVRRGIDSRALPEQPSDEQLFVCSPLAEPLVPVGKATTRDENRRLAFALKSFGQRKEGDDFGALVNFLEEHPSSPWRVALLANLGYLYRYSGYFTKALEAWEEAWRIGKSAQEPRARNMVNWALGHLAELNGRLGRYERLELLLGEIKNRPISGATTERLAGAIGGMGIMKTTPHRAFMCGPLALRSLWSRIRISESVPQSILQAGCTKNGTSLAQLEILANEAGMNYQMARRTGGTNWSLPAVIHWKAGHFATLLGEKEGLFHVRDATFAGDYMVSRKAIESESSGYFLVASGKLPPGWQSVDPLAGSAIWGKGPAENADPRETRSCDKKVGAGCSDCRGMPQYSMHALSASLNIVDTPVGLAPPRGHPLDLTLTYNQRDAGQTSGNFTYSNLGPKWTLNWLAYVTDMMQAPAETSVDFYLPGGGYETYPLVDGAFPEAQLKSRAKMAKVSAPTTPQNPTGIQYELTYPDGAKLVFGLPTSAAANRKFFMTQTIDAQGNGLTFTYMADNSFRLDVVDNRTDPFNAATATVKAKLSYVGADNKVAGVTITTPSGASRSAKMEYNVAGYLERITDAVGLVSTFKYLGTGLSADFITSMTTPYGTTTFSMEKPPTANENDRWLTATDPFGQPERVAYIYTAPIPQTETQVPESDIALLNKDLHWRNSFYWDKKAMQSSGDPTILNCSASHIFHWTHGPAGYDAYGILASEKMPLEGRVWYRYGGQSDGKSLPSGATATASPIRVGRVLDDKSTQLYKYSYNELGNVTSVSDPSGRTTTFTYEANNIDLRDVRQTVQTGTELLASFTYTAQHLPRTVTDAAGRITGFLYNTYGQITTVTNAKMEQTTFNYNTTSGFLESAIVPDDAATPIPVANRTTTFTPDNAYRVLSSQDGDGYLLTYSYDNLDRLTQVMYPDNTPGTSTDNLTEKIVYNKLDPVLIKDKQGRWSSSAYDALRRLVATRDSLGRTTFFDWCSCGSLSSLVDSLGRSTIWERDLQGRSTRKVLPDGSAYSYQYETSTSRLMTVTDPKGQSTKYRYYADNNLDTLVYDSLIYTPPLKLTFEKYYNRLQSLTDGNGVSQYAYRSIIPFSPTPTPSQLTQALGAARLASIDGPLANDIIGFGYDELGRVTSKTNGIGGTVESIIYDALGRVKSAINPLGTFTYAYQAASDRPTTISLPYGLTTEFNYLPASAAANFLRLQRIWNKDGANNISKFEYDYTPGGQIKTMTQTIGTAASTFYAYSYDAANQMYRAALSNGVPTVVGSLIKEFVYGYEEAGNRVREHQSSPLASYTAKHNNVNQQQNRKAGEMVKFLGTAVDAVNPPVSTTVGGIPASMDGNNFEGYAIASSDDDVVPIRARDKYGNTSTKKYRVEDLEVSGTDKSYYYDLNGNLIKAVAGATTTTYDWDGADRLVAMERFNSATRSGRTEFTYDGLGRRTRIVEKDVSSSITSDRRFVWCGTDICEERNSGNATTRRYYNQGMKIVSGANVGDYFYMRDHQGSVRELIDTSKVVRARYAYDPYGKRGDNQIVSSPVEAEFGFTGHLFHSPSGLYLAMFRAYDPESGRWLSRDPIAEDGGVNLYAYCLYDTVNCIDPLGLSIVSSFLRGFAGGVISAGVVVAAAGFAVGLGVSAPIVAGVLATLAVVSIAGAIASYVKDPSAENVANIAGGFVGAAVVGGLSGRGLSGVLSPARSKPSLPEKCSVMDRFYYEVGQGTKGKKDFEKYDSIQDPIARGKRMVQDKGVLAVLPSAKGLILGVGTTFSTGPTPDGAAGTVALSGGAVNTVYRAVSPK